MKRLIGWRTANFLRETADRDLALNWSAHEEILPIFEGDPNTTFQANEQPDSTTSDRYRAELYDEVWQKARDMGYGNVTEALIALERMKTDTIPTARELLERAESALRSDGWHTTASQIRALLDKVSV